MQNASGVQKSQAKPVDTTPSSVGVLSRLWLASKEMRRAVLNFVSFVLALAGVAQYYDVAHPSTSIHPLVSEGDRGNPMPIPMQIENTGSSTFRVEDARCASRTYPPDADDWNEDAATPGSGCAVLSGDAPVLRPHEVAAFLGASPSRIRLHGGSKLWCW